MGNAEGAYPPGRARTKVRWASAAHEHFGELAVPPGPTRGGEAPSAFPIVDRVLHGALYVHAGRLTAQNGDVRPGQWNTVYGMVNSQTAAAGTTDISKYHKCLTELKLNPIAT